MLFTVNSSLCAVLRKSQFGFTFLTENAFAQKKRERGLGVVEVLCEFICDTRRIVSPEDAAEHVGLSGSFEKIRVNSWFAGLLFRIPY